VRCCVARPKKEKRRFSTLAPGPHASWGAQELDAKVRTLREEVKRTRKQYDKTEDDLKALQSVGQIIGEVLRQLDAERCACP